MPFMNKPLSPVAAQRATAASPNRIRPYIRLLHLLLATGIVVSLVTSLFSERPEAGEMRSAVEAIGFEVHELAGMAVLAVLAVHWLAFAVGNAYKGIGYFFPWFSPTRLRGLGAELRQFARLELGEPGAQDAVAGAVQGFGLVIGSALAATGAMLYFGIAPDGSMSTAVHAVKELHETLGPAMWAYLVIHAGAAAVHLLVGHRSVLDVFWLFGR